MSDDDNKKTTGEEFLNNLDFENFEGTVFDLITESPLFHHMLEKCETPEDKENSRKIVEATAKQYDKLIGIIRDNIKTEKDVESLLRAVQSVEKYRG